MCGRTIYIFSLILVLGLASVTLADLVAYWPLDEGSGDTTADVTENGHDGILKNGVVWETTDVHLGSAALSFDGTDDYVEVPDHDALDLSNEFTIAAWIKLSEAGISGRRPFGTNLTNVSSIAIGFGDKNNLQPSGSGLVFFDDIRLYWLPEPEPAP